MLNTFSKILKINVMAAVFAITANLSYAQEYADIATTDGIVADALCIGSDDTKDIDCSQATAPVVDASGNLGVATSTPSTALDVSGTLRISNGGETCDASVSGALRYNTASSKLELCDSTAWVALADGNSGGSLWTDNGDGTIRRTSRIQIGTGATGTPKAALHIRDAIPYMIYQDTSNSGNASFWSFGVADNGSVSRFDIARSLDGGATYTKSMTFLEDGNVGIGTVSPNYELDVSGTIHADVVSATTFVGDGSGLTGVSGLWTDAGDYINYNNARFYKPATTIDVSQGEKLFIWDEDKGAIRAGTNEYNAWDDINIGTNSVSMGRYTTASGDRSIAIGSLARATTADATAIGSVAVASGYNAFAFGVGGNINSGFSTPIGAGQPRRTEASGMGSIAFQRGFATASYAKAFGYYTNATGSHSTAIGRGSQATGTHSVTLGDLSVASGAHSVAVGQNAKVSGANSIVIAAGDVTGTDVTDANTIALMGATGGVGIGTVSPDYELDVSGTIHADVVSATAFVGDGSQLTGISSGLWTDNTDYINYGDFRVYKTGASPDYNSGETGVFWHTDKAAFRAGLSATGGTNAFDDAQIGVNSFALNGIASGDFSIVLGTGPYPQGTQASGGRSVVIGNGDAKGSNSYAIGPEAIAVASYDIAIGYKARTIGTTFGKMAIGDSAVAQNGRGNMAVGPHANADGVGSYYGAMAVGQYAKTSGLTGNTGFNMAVGPFAESQADGAFTAGYGVVASGLRSSAYGYDVAVSGNDSMVIGVGADATGSVVTDTNTLAILGATGGVGIGTVSPDYELDVSGTIHADVVSATAFVGDGSQLTGVVADSVVMGIDDLIDGKNQNNSIGIGGNAQQGTGEFSVALGSSALRKNNSDNNTAIGYRAMRGPDSSYYSGSTDNVAIGYQALTSIVSNSVNNVAVGSGALTSAQGNTSDNVVIGRNAGDEINGGNRNILIGSGVDTSAPTASDELNIGNVIYGDLAGGAVTVSNTLIAETVSATTFVGDGSGLTGVSGLWTDAGDYINYGNARFYKPATTIDVSHGEVLFIWDEDKGAVRAGHNEYNAWDDGNVGTYSIAMGQNTTASGNSSVALGGHYARATNTHAIALGAAVVSSGLSSFAIGGNGDINTGFNTLASSTRRTEASGNAAVAFQKGFAAADYARALGYHSNATADYATALGSGSQATGTHSVTLGSSSIASGAHSVAVGQNAKVSGANSIVIAAGDVTGTDVTDANTIALMGAIGGVGIGTVSPDYELDVSGTIHADVVSATAFVGDGSQLTGISSGLWTDNTDYINYDDFRIYKTGTTLSTTSGQPLIFWDKDKYAFRAGLSSGDYYWGDSNIGLGSVAFGYRTRASGNYSFAHGVDYLFASGHGSVAFGESARAQGSYSFAFGDGGNVNDSIYNTVASGYHSFAFGSSAKATGDRSTAFQAEATGGYSFAIGGATASGGYSVASGSSIASGSNSIAMGQSSEAAAANAIAIGDNAHVTGTNSVMLNASDITGTILSDSNTIALMGATGGVGIGTVSPNYELDVSGTIHANTVSATTFVGDGSGLTGVVGTPAGTDMQIQFNDNGTLAGSSIIYDKSLKKTVFGDGTINNYIVAHSIGGGYAGALNVGTNNPGTYEGALHIAVAGYNHIPNPDFNYGIMMLGTRDGQLDNTPKAVLEGDTLPGIGFAGFKGTTLGADSTIGASIHGIVDGTVSSSALPTGLMFRTATAVGALSEKMRISSNGNVGIGTTTPTAELDVSGSIVYSGTLTDISDERLKENIENLPEGQLDNIDKIRPVSFTMKGTNETEFGVIAQEIETVYPQLVKTADDERQTKSVNYMGLLAPMVQAMQELKAENDALRKQNTNILSRLEQLEKAMSSAE